MREINPELAKKIQGSGGGIRPSVNVHGQRPGGVRRAVVRKVQANL